MYNPEIKGRFINYYTRVDSTRKSLVSQFEAIEPGEQKYGLDICMLSLQQAQEVFDSLRIIRAGSKKTYKLTLTQYCRWCLDNIDGATDSLLKVNYGVQSDVVTTKMIGNPTDLQNLLNIMFEPEDENSFSNVYRCFYWMIYSGLTPKEAESITISDVDLDNGVFVFAGKMFPIYKPGIKAVEKCVNLKAFIYSHPNYTHKISRARIKSNSIIRGIKSVPTASSLLVEASKINRRLYKEGGVKVTLKWKDLWLSGEFLRLYQQEVLGEEVNLSSLAEQYIDRVIEKLGENIITYPIRVTRELSVEYKQWKAAFIR